VLLEEREIVFGQQLIDRQYRLIAELEHDGRDTTQAVTLLMQLLEGQELHEDERDWLKERLAKFHD
jgi:hypothetical protein